MVLAKVPIFLTVFQATLPALQLMKDWTLSGVTSTSWMVPSSGRTCCRKTTSYPRRVVGLRIPCVSRTTRKICIRIALRHRALTSGDKDNVRFLSHI
jgi:hypothetical protein